MSRIGKRPVPLPSGVTATTEGQILSVKGPKGTLHAADARRDRLRHRRRPDQRPAGQCDQAGARLLGHAAHARRRTWSPASREGFTKVLEITGVGYRAAAQGKKLQ